MAEPLHRQLLSQARRLARLDPKRPRQANLRRAVSAACYALFHYLADQSSRCIFGTSNERRPFRDVYVRAFAHGTMRHTRASFAGGTLPRNLQSRLPTTFSVPGDLQSVAQAFNEAQEKRHLADYDLTATFSRADVLVTIGEVEQAITEFGNINSRDESRFFLACLLAWDSLAGRK